MGLGANLHKDPQLEKHRKRTKGRNSKRRSVHKAGERDCGKIPWKRKRE
jgi:hypothetical protein